MDSNIRIVIHHGGEFKTRDGCITTLEARLKLYIMLTSTCRPTQKYTLKISIKKDVTMKTMNHIYFFSNKACPIPFSKATLVIIFSQVSQILTNIILN